MAESEVRLEPEGKRQYPCGQCGAKSGYAPGTSFLKCPYCGHETRIEASSESIEELDYHIWLRSVAGQQPTDESPRVSCAGCGAETTLPPSTSSGQCPFCGSNLVVAPSHEGKIRPKSLLPFRLPYQEAVRAFRKWIRSRWFAPNDLVRHAETEGKLAGVYLPFWTYDADTTSAYTGERGDAEYVTRTYTEYQNGRQVQRSRQERRIRWTRVAGVVRKTFDDVLVLASESLPQKFARVLEPWDLAALVPYCDDYLSGFRAESYRIGLEKGFEMAKETMGGEIREAVRKDIRGDEQRIHSVNTAYDNISFKHVLLPVWLSAYRYRGRVFRFAINARTGEVTGERPYSPWKIAAAVTVALLVLLIVAVLVPSR